MQLDLLTTETTAPVINRHHIAAYNGKEVVIDYCDRKEEFKFACYRISDNCAEGIVICPNGKRYQISKNSRSAKLINE